MQKGFREPKKKETMATLERKIKNALVFIAKDKDYIGVFFSDRGLRLEVTSDACVISTGYHRHVFTSFNAAGYSRPFLYTKRIIEIANKNDCKTDDGYSFEKLLEVLKAKEDKTEYNIVTYVDWWIFNCFQPLYSIGKGEIESFLVYENYLHNIARNAILLSEKTEDMTNKQFFDAVIKNMQEFIDGVDERVIFHKKTDEEVARENMDAIVTTENEQIMEGQQNDNK